MMAAVVSNHGVEIDYRGIAHDTDEMFGKCWKEGLYFS